ncbi:MAG: DsbA family protein [Alphaproteobacteria bacterium]|nr:DsbA family protein [Alphaproteobacteria bacterium]
MKKIITFFLCFLFAFQTTCGPKSQQKAKVKSNNETGFETKLKKMQFPDNLKLPEIVVGNPNAPVTLIVYSSFTCSHCRDFHLNIFPKFKKEYVDTGKVKVYLRCFLDDLGALEAAVLMRSFGKNDASKSEKIYRGIYQKLKAWLNANNPRDFLKDIFIGMGYSREDVEKNIENRKISAGLMEYMQRALKEVHSVPAFVCGNKKHEGSITYEQLKEMCGQSN